MIEDSAIPVKPRPASHTPGPWRQLDFMRYEGSTLITDAEVTVGVCRVIRSVPSFSDDPTPDMLRRDIERVVANANLIAAAPDLLEACKTLLSLWDDPCPYDAATTRAMARQTIAQAEGKAVPNG